MAKGIQSISYNQLGGMRTDVPITLFTPSDALYARNVRFRKSPQPSKRRGGKKFNSTVMASATPILGGFDYHYGAAGQRFIEVNNTVIYIDDKTTRTPIKTGMTTGKYYSMAAFDDYAWIVNGTDKMVKYDGANGVNGTATQASMDAPILGTMTAIQVLTQAFTSISNANPAVGTATAHGLKTGDRIQLTTTGTLPTGLSLLTNYYIIRAGADTMNFSDTLAHALAGTNKVVTSGAGSGTHTWVLQPTTAGALTASSTYQYLVTNYNATTFQESQPSWTAGSGPLGVSITLSSTSTKVYLQDIPVSADPNVTARRIYRTTANGSILNAQLLYTIPDNTTTTYLDLIGDGSLGMLIKLYLDAAPLLQKIQIHKNRAFGFINNSSRLYFSVLFNCWYWPQGLVDLTATAKQFYIDINPDDGDYITNIIPYNDELVIFKQNNIYLLSGYDETDFSVRKVQFRDNVGCVGFRAAAVADNWLYFVDANGIFRTNMQMIDYIGSAMEAFFDQNNTTVGYHVNSKYLTNSIAFVDDRKPNNLIKFCLPMNTSTMNNVDLVYDYKTGFWSYDTGKITQSLCYSTTDGLDSLVRGDDIGWVWDDESQDGEGGLVYSRVTAVGNTTISDTGYTDPDTGLVVPTQNWTVNSLAGAWVEMLTGSNKGERRLIISNTATEITVAAWIDGTYFTNPSAMDFYTIGGIDFYYQTGWCNYGDSALTKNLKFIRIRIEATGSFQIKCSIGYDFNSSLEELTPIQLVAGATWGTSKWGAMYWGGKTIFDVLMHTPSDRIHGWTTFAIEHKPAGQPVTWDGFERLFSIKGYGIRE